MGRAFAFAALLLAAVAIPSPVGAQKAPRFKACKKAQPAAKLNECLRDSIQKAIPELVKGLPELQFKSLDPLRIQALEVGKGKSAVSVDLSFKDLDIYGLRNAKIRSINLDVDKYRMTGKIDVEGSVSLQGNYKVKGKVLVLPIEGSGPCNITIENIKAELVELQARPINRDGQKFAQITSFKFVVNDVDKVYYDLANLFNGNKELGENMNLVLNDNWKQIFDDMRGPFQVALGVAFRDVIDKVLHKVPYNKIFP